MTHMARRDEWMAQAACRGMDPDLFHPDRGDSTAPAKTICARCPVRVECLEHALEHHTRDDMGIWGGTSAKQRREIKRGRRREAA